MFPVPQGEEKQVIAVMMGAVGIMEISTLLSPVTSPVLGGLAMTR